MGKYRQHLFDFSTHRPDDGLMKVVVPTERGDHRGRQRTDGVTVHGPVHPRWTHAPLGGLVFVAVFDVASVVGSSRPWSRDLYRSGTFVLSAMLVLVVAAVGTGLIDRGRATVAETRLRGRVNLHAAVMNVMAVASAGDLALRRFAYSDARHTPVAVLATTVVALGAALVGGDLGGRLTYRAGVGVRPQDPVVRSDVSDPV
jgi:uncharacterized membrane protein